MTDGLRSIRPLKAESLRGVQPAEIGRVKPKFEWVDPGSLFVEESYQRDINEGGIGLIRKIFSRFSWARFKTPICVRLPDSGNVLVCIDGQHTATAAATHPDIDKIPVMVVSAEDAKARASSFVGHNRERLALTAPMIYRAELAAGEPLAVTVDRACRAAGAKVLPTSISLNKPTEVGATIAVGALKAVVKSAGEDGLVRVLRVMIAAKRGPIKAGELSAAAMVLAGFPTPIEALDARLAGIIASKTAEQWAAIAAAAVAESGVSSIDATASAWLRALGMRAPVKQTARSVKREAPSDNLTPDSVKPVPRPTPSVPPSSPPPAKALPPNPVARPAASESPKPAAQVKPIPAAPVSPQAAPIERNGIVLHPDGLLRHRGTETRLYRQDVIDVVSSLLRVMPSVLGGDRIAAKAFPKSTVGQDLLRTLIGDLNPKLAGARLTIKTVGKIGYVLADLGAG